MKRNNTNIKFIRIKTEHAVLILTAEEYLNGIDRENFGIPDKFTEEGYFIVN